MQNDRKDGATGIPRAPLILRAETKPQLSAEGEKYRQLITAAWEKSVASHLEVGRLLIKAQAELEEGDTFKNLVEGRHLPFGTRTAYIHIKIAQHETLSNAKFISRLPNSWAALSELARMPPGVVSDFIEHGDVHPDMSVSDAKRLRASRAGAGASKALKLFDNLLDKGVLPTDVAKYIVEDLEGVRWDSALRNGRIDKLGTFVADICDALKAAWRSPDRFVEVIDAEAEQDDEGDDTRH